MNATVVRPAPVRQEEIRELQAIREEQARLQQRHDRLRGCLVDRLTRGAVMEPGPLRAVIYPHVSRRVTRNALYKIVGREETARILGLIPAVTVDQLFVETFDGDAAGRPYSPRMEDAARGQADDGDTEVAGES